VTAALPRLVGTCDKHHPYSPELNCDGISAGTEVPVFQTDFGKIGMMICYDVSSWNNGYGVWDTAGRSVVNPDADPTVDRLVGLPTFKDVRQSKVGGIGLSIVSLDLESSPSPVYTGGTMLSAPGGRRNRGEQRTYLEEEIKKERQRWWEAD
jgi:hypothetical protein